MMTVYSFLLTLGLAVSAPWWLCRMATSGRYREGLAGRLGFVPKGLREAVEGAAGVVWVHAVSVGEVLAVERVVSELREALDAKYGAGWVVAVSTTTATGQKIARERLGTAGVFYFPLDFGFAVRRYLRVLRPKLMVLVESELWPRLLAECESAGVPVAVVNARLSDRSFRRTMRVRGLWGWMARKVTVWLAQGEETAGRLRELGVGAERVRVTGNLKYDRPGGGENAMVRTVGRSLWQSRLVVAGSTHEGEEAALFGVWQEVVKTVPDAAWLIAPRQPERFDAVWELMRERKLPAIRCSYLLSHVEPVFGGIVLLLDTVGDLAAMYGIASAAFVGGSLVAKGGQNPLEPARFGVPVVMGPSYENFREIVGKMISDDALTITDEAGLAGALIDALRKRPTGPQFFEGLTGAANRTTGELLRLIRGEA